MARNQDYDGNEAKSPINNVNEMDRVLWYKENSQYVDLIRHFSQLCLKRFNKLCNSGTELHKMFDDAIVATFDGPNVDYTKIKDCLDTAIYLLESIKVSESLFDSKCDYLKILRILKAIVFGIAEPGSIEIVELECRLIIAVGQYITGLKIKLHQSLSNAIREVRTTDAKEIKGDIIWPNTSCTARNISFHRLLGRGSYAAVYEVTLNGGKQKHAIKVTSINETNMDQFTNLLREIILQCHLFTGLYSVKYNEAWIQNFIDLPVEIRKDLSSMYDECNRENIKYDVDDFPPAVVNRKCLIMQMDVFEGMCVDVA